MANKRIDPVDPRNVGGRGLWAGLKRLIKRMTLRRGYCDLALKERIVPVSFG